MKTKEEWIKELDLEPHVEGGYFRQTYKAIETVELPDKRIRALSTSGNGQKLQFTVPAGVVFGSTIESDNQEDFAIVSCSVTPGFEYEDFILYTRDELLEKYPEHEKIIRRLAVISK